MDRTFAAAPIDDIQLEREARPWVASLQGHVADGELLRRLTRERDADLAAMVFYQSILASPRHAEFIAAVDSQPIPESPRASSIKLFVVPAFLYREFPTLGGDGAHILRVAHALGMEAELVPTSSTGSVRENAEVLRRALKACDREDIWLLSLSKGGAEVRLLLQEQADAIPLTRITHWFNISGLANGSQLVDNMTQSRLRRVRLGAMCLATGTRLGVLQELRTDHPLWRTPFTVPAGISIVNIMGVPLSSHVERALVTRYKRIRHLGPNDGMVLLSDALIEPGLVYPIWGTDHYMRDARIIPILYRLLSYFSERTHYVEEEQPRKGDRP